MQIQRYDNISYKGLSRTLGKSLYSYNNIKRIQTIYKESNPNGIVGSLPHQWVKNMPIENRGENIKEFYIQIGKLIQEISDKKSFQKKINNLLKKYNAIKQDDVVKVNFEGVGAFGKCYKIESSNPEQPALIVKKFKKWTHLGNEWTHDHRHGTECEINTKNYVKSNLKKQGDKKLFSKFYYGDIENKYYVENYVDRVFDEEREVELIYPRTEFVRNCLDRVSQTLEKIGIHHNDLKPWDLIFCSTPQEWRLYPVCCDLGGVSLVKNNKYL